MSHFMVCGNLFEVQAKYTPIKPTGKGAYGVVCSARNVETVRGSVNKKTPAVHALAGSIHCHYFFFVYFDTYKILINWKIFIFLV